MRQITGKDNAKDALASLKSNMNDSMIGNVLKKVVDASSTVAGFAEDTINGMSGGMGNLLSGSKVDFPSIWKGAGYTSSKSITVRLYNPVPTSHDAYIKYIVWPILQILAFVVPQSDADDGSSVTYHSPVLCTACCPGLWEIKAGYVSSVEVVKGGEANDLNFEHHPGMVDIRIGFGELYNVLTTHSTKKDRPTLQKYMQTLVDSPDVNLNIFVADHTDTTSTTNNNTDVKLATSSVSSTTTNIQPRVLPQETQMAKTVEVKTICPEGYQKLQAATLSLKESPPTQRPMTLMYLSDDEIDRILAESGGGFSNITTTYKYGR